MKIKRKSTTAYTSLAPDDPAKPEQQLTQSSSRPCPTWVPNNDVAYQQEAARKKDSHLPNAQ